ncbi:hypothetical protein HGP16_14520 [Rhizobium sp. P40RR-XXII]|nr:hypothetical protein [Rhizobium sp. P40RR-XXII]NLS17774.1 hypothetical protein [Rhizobium sp. P40RR-XXII]
MKSEAKKTGRLSSKNDQMLRSIATYLKKSWPFLVPAMLIILVIVAYEMGEMLEKNHRALMDNVRYAIAAFLLFVSVYFIALLVRTIWTMAHDKDDQ